MRIGYYSSFEYIEEVFLGWLLVANPNFNTREAGDLQRAVLSIRELKRDQRERNKQIENECVSMVWTEVSKFSTRTATCYQICGVPGQHPDRNGVCEQC